MKQIIEIILHIKKKKRTDMELCQGDNTLSPKQTNQEHTSRGRHKLFNNVENPHHVASPKLPRENNQVDKSADTKLYLNIRNGI